MTTEIKQFITSWHPPTAHFVEIYSSGLEFAFVSAKGQQCHPFAFCKDFLQDAVWATLHKKKVDIYGFSYNSAVNPPLSMKATRIAVRLKNIKGFLASRQMDSTYGTTLAELCARSLTFLHLVEKTQGFSRSKLVYGGKYEGSDDDVWVFRGDPQWMFSPVLLSMYTTCIRVGASYNGGDWREHFQNAKHYLGPNDASYSKTAAKRLDEFMGKPPQEVFAPTMMQNYPEDIGVSSLHHTSGIVTFGNRSIPTTISKHWATVK